MSCLIRSTRRSILFVALLYSLSGVGFIRQANAQAGSYNLTSSYIVQSGDTLSVIAARYGTTVHAIANTNNIRNINNIRIGQVIVIPGQPNAAPPAQPTAVPLPPVPAPTQPPALQPTASSYAQQSSTNHSQPSYSTQSSASPSYAPLPQPTQSVAPYQPQVAPAYRCQGSPSGQERIHNVRPGDTLYGISRAYGVTVTAVRQRNGLASDRIRVGECLIVPAGVTVTSVPDRRRSSEQPPVTSTPTASPTPVAPVYTAQSQG